MRFDVPADCRGARLDLFLLETKQFDSRHQVQKLVRGGMVLVDGTPAKPSCRLRPLQEIRVTVPPPEPVDAEPVSMPLRILFEDQDLIVVDKPAGLVVHPAAGHLRDTLVNALLHHCRDLSGIGGTLRPGIVHRLDKGTSGVLVAAKNDAAHLALSRQFQEHSILREYLGLVRGSLEEASGVIRAPIGRHPLDRKRMSTRSSRGKDAITHWSVERRYSCFTLVRFVLKTGRTHQIRVHMKELGHPIIGDPLYGGRRAGTADLGVTEAQARAFSNLDRPFLHAEKLGFLHPRDRRFLVFLAPLPAELHDVLRVLG